MKKDNENIYSMQFNISEMLTQWYFSLDNYISIHFDHLWNIQRISRGMDKQPTDSCFGTMGHANGVQTSPKN